MPCIATKERTSTQDVPTAPDGRLTVPRSRRERCTGLGSRAAAALQDNCNCLLARAKPRREPAKHLPRIAHVQLADNPGRNEPGTGKIDYPFLFRHLDAIGYRGWIGCEHQPRTTIGDGLGWHAALTLDT